MAIILGYFDENESNFAVQLFDVRQKKLAINLIKEGIEAWYAADNIRDNIEPTEHFSADVITLFLNSGYVEPVEALLHRFDIKYRLIDLIYDNNGELITHVDEIL